MISPRRTTLVRTPDLPGFRAALLDRIAGRSVWSARRTFVLVPSAAAAEQLRRSVEALAPMPSGAMAFPHLGTRAGWYHALAGRLPRAPRLLSSFEREVILASAARAAEARDIAPPFHVRPGLVAEMLDLYDHVRRLNRSVHDFERNFRGHLEPAVEVDRGAAKLLQQTVFLAAIFDDYEARVAAGDALDEHGLRQRLLGEPSDRPITDVVVSVGDRLSDPGGLWPADFDLLTRLPGLERLDIVATEGALTAGLLGRLQAAFPGMDEARAGTPAASPRFVGPPAMSAAGKEGVFVSRDREEELADVARRVKADQRQPGATPLDRIALVVHRPLPYLYLAKDVFAGAGIPFETLDTLPLAAEPYASAVDVVLEWVTSDFTRQSTVAVLRSPHFRLAGDVAALPGAGARATAALDAALAEARHLGGLDRLQALVDEWSSPGSGSGRRLQHDAVPAGRVALAAAEAVRPLAETRPMVDQIACLLSFLRTFDAAPSESDPDPARRQRVQGSVVGALNGLADAYSRHDPAATADASALSASVRRWLGARTFAVRTGAGGLQIVDASAARYGTFDDVQLLGVIDGDWPERQRRPVFFPSALMGLLEPESADPDRRERDAAHAARAAFVDLLRSSHGTVRVSTVLLENDAVVDRSILLDEIANAGLTASAPPARDPVRIFQYEAMAGRPHALDSLPPGVAAWAALRREPRGGDTARFHGWVGPWRLPRISVSRLERYLECPFRFFSSEVLRLEEEPDDEEGQTPLERGRFLHELFEAFFSEWQRRGHGRIDEAALDEARAVFTEVCESKLRALSPSEARLERVRLEGSAVSAGIAHRVLEMEAARPAGIVERLLEYQFDGAFTFRRAGGEPREVVLRGTADRIDLLEDGTLRVIDYKSKKTPDPRQALQLPVYSLCARERLQGRRGRSWEIGEAAYLSFEGDRAVVPLGQKGQTIDETIALAEDRLLTTLDAIERGVFPPRPAKRSLCTTCAFSAVCRKEWVDDEDE